MSHCDKCECKNNLGDYEWTTRINSEPFEPCDNITADDVFALMNSIDVSYRHSEPPIWMMHAHSYKKINGYITGVWYKTPRRLRGTYKKHKG